MSEENCDVQLCHNLFAHNAITLSSKNRNNNSKSTSMAVVRFSRKVEIIEFPVVLGDNPGVKMGPPIAMGQQELSRRVVDLEEEDAQEEPKKRREGELRLSVAARNAMLLEAGYTRKEITDVINALTE